MKKYFTKRHIMEFLCISSAQFETYIKQLKIPCVIEENKRLYVLNNIIQIYDFMNKKVIIDFEYEIFESKINFNTDL